MSTLEVGRSQRLGACLAGLCLAGTLLLPPPSTARPGEATGTPFRVPRVAGDVRVDGVLDEAAWRDALALELAYEVEPGENTPAPMATTCLVAYDEGSFYVAFRARDTEPGSVRARYGAHDGIEDDDAVSFTLDTFNDRRRGYLFGVNPLGVQFDATVDETGAGTDATWDAIWASAGRITDDGFVVEVAIPFAALRFPSDRGELTWGFSAKRVRRRSTFQRFSIHPVDRDVESALAQAVRISGLAGVRPGKSVELDPALTATRTDQRDAVPDGALERGETETDVGLTARWGVTPSLLLDATVNPDFSQVEADAAQLDINNLFALYYDEKRPFFLEGAGVFADQLGAVYTRTVADPEWGAKLTGRLGRGSLGLLAARDRITNLLFPGLEGSSLGALEQESSTALARYRLDVGQGSTLGVLLTDREGHAYHNRLLAVDGFLRLGPSDRLSFEAAASDTAYPDEVAASFGQPQGAFRGAASSLSYLHRAREWGWSVDLTQLDPEFRADAGFVSQVGMRTAILGLDRTWWGTSQTWYTQLYAGGSYVHVESTGGELQQRRTTLYLNAYGPWDSFCGLSTWRRTFVYRGVAHDQDYVGLALSAQPTAAVYARAVVSLADTLDYSQVREGRQLRAVGELHLQLGRHLRLELDQDRRDLALPEGTLFRARLTELRAVVHANTRLRVRLITQYQDVERNPALYAAAVKARSTEVFNQLLVSYTVNPRTLVFLGYSGSHVGWTGVEPLLADRTFFAKLAYAGEL